MSQESCIGFQIATPVTTCDTPAEIATMYKIFWTAL